MNYYQTDVAQSRRNRTSLALMSVCLMALGGCGETDSIELAFSSSRVGGFGQCMVDIALHNNSSRRLNALQVQFGYEIDGRSYGATAEFANVGPGANAQTLSSSGNAPRPPDCVRIQPRIISVGRCDLEGQREEACAKAVSLSQ